MIVPETILGKERKDSMRLKLFDTIDEALALLEENNAFYHEVEKDIRKALKDLFANKTEMIVDVNSRVKSKESLREKIIRNRFYVDLSLIHI